MEKLIKENLIVILAVVLVIVGGLYATIHFGAIAFENHGISSQKKVELESKRANLEQIKAQKLAQAQKEEKKEISKSGKVIYEVLGQQFSPEASFGIMFENIISNMTNSGIRIRSIDYNYTPQNDQIVQANIPGYNACELSFVTVGNYSQLQAFFKNITKENYLTNIYEIYIEPYDKDKTILIAKFKIRLYTKTI